MYLVQLGPALRAMSLHVGQSRVSVALVDGDNPYHMTLQSLIWSNNAYNDTEGAHAIGEVATTPLTYHMGMREFWCSYFSRP